MFDKFGRYYLFTSYNTDNVIKLLFHSVLLKLIKRSKLI